MRTHADSVRISHLHPKVQVQVSHRPPYPLLREMGSEGAENWDLDSVYQQTHNPFRTGDPRLLPCVSEGVPEASWLGRSQHTRGGGRGFLFVSSSNRNDHVSLSKSGPVVQIYTER